MIYKNMKPRVDKVDNLLDTIQYNTTVIWCVLKYKIDIAQY